MSTTNTVASSPAKTQAAYAATGTEYSVTIHLLPHTDATRTTPPAQFDPERRDLYEGTILKIGRQVKSVSKQPLMGKQVRAPDSDPVAAAALAVVPGIEVEDVPATPVVIEPPSGQLDTPVGNVPQALTPNLTGLSVEATLDTRTRALTSTAESPQSVPAVEVLLAQPGGQQPLVPTKSIEHVWFKSKVVSRSHAEMWLRDGQVYLKDTGSSSGTFLNKMRLSPSGKLSRPYPLKDGDVIQLGIDYQGRPEGD
ncbi:hypothetical protein HDU82_000969 [Entophlyctis luteolus]|nr:hypothetical protein HDU82_000969 [Entophlyctis luteolus]KAJ3393456.1 hypothetical protein HDU84_001947 [Entophlyctis sp. JEL0112]